MVSEIVNSIDCNLVAVCRLHALETNIRNGKSYLVFISGPILTLPEQWKKKREEKSHWNEEIQWRNRFLRFFAHPFFRMSAKLAQLHSWKMYYNQTRFKEHIAAVIHRQRKKGRKNRPFAERCTKPQNSNLNEAREWNTRRNNRC